MTAWKATRDQLIAEGRAALEGLVASQAKLIAMMGPEEAITELSLALATNQSKALSVAAPAVNELAKQRVSGKPTATTLEHRGERERLDFARLEMRQGKRTVHMELEATDDDPPVALHATRERIDGAWYASISLAGRIK